MNSFTGILPGSYICYCLCFLLHYNSRVEWLWQIPYCRTCKSKVFRIRLFTEVCLPYYGLLLFLCQWGTLPLLLIWKDLHFALVLDEYFYRVYNSQLEVIFLQHIDSIFPAAFYLPFFLRSQFSVTLLTIVGCFKFVLFAFHFLQFTMIYLSMDLFIVVGIHWAFTICKLMSSNNSGKF